MNTQQQTPKEQTQASATNMQTQLEERRRELLAQAGLKDEPSKHFKRPKEHAFTAEQRANTTILLGGFTVRHDRLVKAGLEGLGYNIECVPVPTKADFQAGKEYGNNGQCNPTYFTVGALVNYLKNLRDKQGMSTEDILKNYVFLTAGACGPCRFGMYEAEFRLALRNSGFDEFRVMLFQQKGGLSQSDVQAGLEMNLNFFLSLLNAIFIGDLLNEVAYHIRPYEVEKGKTDEVFERCIKLCENALRQKNYAAVQPGPIAKMLSKFTPVKNGEEAAKFIDQMQSDWYADTLRQCMDLIDREIAVDYTKAKPIAKITGEFWAQTTEGDGNFHMFSFLEREGAEVLVEPIATWILYLLNQAKNLTKDRRGLRSDGTPAKSVLEKMKLETATQKKLFGVDLATKLVKREVERLRKALGGTAHEQACQLELTRAGHPYYHSRSAGGEGHLEVAKNIYYTQKELAHMVLSLKPFGCMPSTQSDGAQAAVMANFSDMIYLPIETSGEGDINAYSRVQMALGEAKQKTREEFKRAVRKTGYDLETIRAYVAEHKDLQRPLFHIPKHKGFIGRAANFVLAVGQRMDSDAAWSTRKSQAQRQESVLEMVS
ncbi:MAG: activator of (R)-2-hydroxyglutaryl-CoA dehydratase [Myxococcota bacterium]